MPDETKMTGPTDDPRDDDATMMDDGSDDLFIRRISRELQAPVAASAGFDARVMAAVHAAAADEAVEARLPRRDGHGPAGPVRRAWGWVARPRTIRVSPLAGLAIAAGIGAILVLAPREGGDGARANAGTMVATREASDTGASATSGATMARTVANRPAATQMVAFVLVAPEAKSVALVGDFNDWNDGAHRLEPLRKGGVWTITVPLAPGQYNYNFVVDGSRVMADPAAPAAPADEFGTPASVVTVARVQS